MKYTGYGLTGVGVGAAVGCRHEELEAVMAASALLHVAIANAATTISTCPRRIQRNGERRCLENEMRRRPGINIKSGNTSTATDVVKIPPRSSDEP